MVILRGVSAMVDEVRPEVIFGLIAELLHESDSSFFAEVHERDAKIMREILTRGVGRGEIAAEKLTPRLAALPFDLVRYQLMVLQLGYATAAVLVSFGLRRSHACCSAPELSPGMERRGFRVE